MYRADTGTGNVKEKKMFPFFTFSRAIVIRWLDGEIENTALLNNFIREIEKTPAVDKCTKSTLDAS